MIDIAVVVQRASTGDEMAWNALVNRYAGMLTSIGRSFRLTPEQSQDVMQDTWVALLQNIENIRDPERIGGWLATTMRRACIRTRQRSAREVPCSDWTDWPSAGSAPGVEEQLLRKERQAILSHAVERLPERQRDLLTALESSESYEGIGTALKMPVGSIGPTRARALHRLRTDLVASGDGIDLLYAS